MPTGLCVHRLETRQRAGCFCGLGVQAVFLKLRKRHYWIAIYLLEKRKDGTLIIRYTDYEGVKHDPIIYTDYLAANARTGANTKVELFEEGDYEVALDYEIVDTSGFNSYTNYRIFFTFSIRNGNCMVYPFDINSGAELSDSAMTENGFKLDMAKSRYLTIDV